MKSCTFTGVSQTPESFKVSTLSIVLIEIIQDGLPSNEGYSDKERSESNESSSVMSLSEFDVTPSPTNSLNDEGGEEEEEARSPDHIQMDVEFPQAQLGNSPVRPQIQAKSASAVIPFPPTPEEF